MNAWDFRTRLRHFNVTKPNSGFISIENWASEIGRIMKHIHYLDVKEEQVSEAGAHGISLRTVIGETDGAPNFFMRVISFEAHSESPSHSHPWEHEAFIVSGTGTVEVDGKIGVLEKGDVVYIPPNADHCFRTTHTMKML
jgi:quercetin dioxygenase-like cupin family protein